MGIKEYITKNEGVRLFPYKCSAGKLTIGVGRNLEDRGISSREAEILLEGDIALAKQDLYDVFGDLVDTFSDKRYTALVDMMFNMGKTRFRGFKKMIKAIEENDWEEAGKQAFDSKWAKQVGTRATTNAILLKAG